MKKRPSKSEYGIVIILGMILLGLVFVLLYGNLAQILEADALVHHEQASALYVGTLEQIGFNTTV